MRFGCRKRLAIALELHPVEDGALKSLLMALLEVGQGLDRSCGPCLVSQHDRPRAIGADGACDGTSAGRWACAATATPTAAPAVRRLASSLDRCGRGICGIDRPGLAIDRVAQAAVRGPSGAAHVLGLVLDTPRRRRRIGRHDVRFGPRAVVAFDARRYRERHPPRVRRDLHAGDALHAVVVLNRRARPRPDWRPRVAPAAIAAAPDRR